MRLGRRATRVDDVSRLFPVLHQLHRVRDAGGASPLPHCSGGRCCLAIQPCPVRTAAWTAAIDLDASPLAVDLQTVLDIVAEEAPARMLESLTAAQKGADGGKERPA